MKATTEPEPLQTAKVTQALAKELPPLKTTLKKVIKQAVAKAGPDSLDHGNFKSTVKSTVKTAVKEVVAEIALESAEKYRCKRKLPFSRDRYLVFTSRQPVACAGGNRLRCKPRL